MRPQPQIMLTDLTYHGRVTEAPLAGAMPPDVPIVSYEKSGEQSDKKVAEGSAKYIIARPNANEGDNSSSDGYSLKYEQYSRQEESKLT